MFNTSYGRSNLELQQLHYHTDIYNLDLATKTHSHDNQCWQNVAALLVNSIHITVDTPGTDWTACTARLTWHHQDRGFSQPFAILRILPLLHHPGSARRWGTFYKTKNNSWQYYSSDCEGLYWVIITSITT